MLWVKSGLWESDGRTAGVETRLEELGEQWVSGETLRESRVVVASYLSVTCVLQQDQTWVSRDRRRLHSTKRLYPSSGQKSKLFFMFLYRRRHHHG